ncbi:hypothetical protein BDQ17DRAFT_1235413 [Cyathus striatus]|nr:hypothetical protein BDQ17DRAFT_1235413 [Cyathus striatus]
MCINATLNGDAVSYQLTALREPLGWLAIGFGRRMKDTHMVIVWSNKDGSATLSQRFATGHREPHPAINPPRIAILDSSMTFGNPSNKTSFAFTMPANTTLLASDEPSETLIWAYSMSRPAKAPDSVLKPHYMAGFFNLDLTKPLAKPLETEVHGQPHHQDDSSKDGSSQPSNEVPIAADGSGQLTVQERILIVHAIFVSLGFLGLLPIGVITARWTRTFSSTWFKQHWILNMALAVPIISIGIIAAPVAIINRGGVHLDDQHAVYGVLLVIAYCIQVFLGRYIHARKHSQKEPPTRPHPPLNILHVILGLSVIGCAFLQVRSGFDEWESATSHTPIPKWMRYLWSSWGLASIILLAYVVGFCLLHRQLYQEARPISNGRETYVSLQNDVSSPDSRLFDDEDDGVDDKVGSEDNHFNTRLTHTL